MTDTPTHRWRPRFSLRTLMIGVLLIALSWTATVIWGVPEILHRSYLGRILGETHPKIISNAIAPFVIRIQYSNQMYDRKEIWIWFPTYAKRMSGTIESRAPVKADY